MHRFVARQNVERCRHRLETETDPTRRAFLLKRLLDEEDKLALDYELLDDLEREIINGHARITRQEVVIRDLESKGGNSTGARALLETFIMTQRLYADYRRKIVAVVEGREV